MAKPLSRIFSIFKKKSQVENGKAQDEAKKNIRDSIAQVAIALNAMLNTGSTLVIDIHSGKIIVPGKSQSARGIIIISKPAFFERLDVKTTSGNNGNAA